jgi:transposase-like protein
MNTVPTIDQFSALFPSNDACFQYLLSKRVFYSSLACKNCEVEMKLNEQKRFFKCFNSKCSAKGSHTSINTGTFFSHSKMSYVLILRIAQLWLAKATVQTAITLLGCSKHTVCNFFNHFRNLVGSALLPEDQYIGGPGIIVEIDETKLGKRKYNRGHRVDGVWVLVGIERLPNGKIFLVPVEDRSSDTLSQHILNHVHPGSTVMTDQWRGYVDLQALGYNHLTVNHSQNYVDPDTGACTNTAEGLNSGLKRRIPVRNRTANGIEGHLFEYVWRRQNRDRLFDALIDAMAEIHYDFE